MSMRDQLTVLHLVKGSTEALGRWLHASGNAAPTEAQGREIVKRARVAIERLVSDALPDTEISALEDAAIVACVAAACAVMRITVKPPAPAN